MSIRLPVRTLPDPKLDGEGKLDPLGLAAVGEHLADRILPGLTARMHRPRFLTAIAVCAAVCEGLEDEVAKDDVSTAPLVFEWLIVEAFARRGDAEKRKSTPGIGKAADALRDGVPMSASAYLKTPNVFGFNGVYKRAARFLNIVDDDLRLCDQGHALVRTWEREQGLDGFLSAGDANSSGPRYILRQAVQKGLSDGHTKYSPQWQGWSLLAEHLLPGDIGREEGRFLRDLFYLPNGEPTSAELAEHFGRKSLLRSLLALDDERRMDERRMIEVVRPRLSDDLTDRFRAIEAYESFATELELVFERLRHLSTVAGARAISPRDPAVRSALKESAGQLPVVLREADEVIQRGQPEVVSLFAALSEHFRDVRDADSLYQAVLARHHEVQWAKPPDGKRDWFERGADDSIFVRPAYRLTSPPERRHGWGRPYRLSALRSFSRDLNEALQ